MWRVIAEEDIRCTECSHIISMGSRCLSQMPTAMPDDFLRRKYQNFCIECAECNAKTRKQGLRARACYTRRLNHWYTSREKTREDVRCGYCDKTISKGASAVAQKIYAWPETELEVVNGINDGAGSDTGSVASGMAARPVSGVITNSTGGWNNLSPQTRRLFQTRGLRGRGLGFRSPEMARRLYEQSVPKAVRNLGDDAVREFLRGKDASHITSVANAPGRAKQPSNIVWENPRTNHLRGSRNMTAAEVAAANSAGRLSALGIAAKATVKSAAKGGVFAAATEAAVSVPENILHWRRGRKSGGQAAKDAAKGTAVAAGVGGATAGVATAASAVGVGISLGPFGTPLMIAGGAFLAGNAIYRISKAAKRDVPLDEYYIFFCKAQRCKTRFARSVTESARDVSV